MVNYLETGGSNGHRLNKEAYFVKEQPIIIYMHFAAKIFQELVDIESK